MSIETVVDECIAKSKAYGDALARSDSKSANRAMAALDKLFAELKGFGAEGEAALLRLSSSEQERAVRYWSTIHLRNAGHAVGKEILEQIAATEDVLGFTARSSLKYG